MAKSGDLVVLVKGAFQTHAHVMGGDGQTDIPSRAGPEVVM